MSRQVSTSTSLMSEEDEDLFGPNLQDVATFDEKKWTRGHLRVRLNP